MIFVSILTGVSRGGMIGETCPGLGPEGFTQLMTTHEPLNALGIVIFGNILVVARICANVRFQEGQRGLAVGNHGVQDTGQWVKGGTRIDGRS